MSQNKLKNIIQEELNNDKLKVNAFEKGYSDYFSMLPIINNPYSINTLMYDEYKNGWLAGKQQDVINEELNSHLNTSTSIPNQQAIAFDKGMEAFHTYGLDGDNFNPYKNSHELSKAYMDGLYFESDDADDDGDIEYDGGTEIFENINTMTNKNNKLKNIIQEERNLILELEYTTRRAVVVDEKAFSKAVYNTVKNLKDVSIITKVWEAMTRNFCNTWNKTNQLQIDEAKLYGVISTYCTKKKMYDILVMQKEVFGNPELMGQLIAQSHDIEFSKNDKGK